MDERFFEEKFSALKGHIDERFDGLENRMDGLEKRMDNVEKRGEGIERLLQKAFVEIEAIRESLKMVAEGHVMLNERFDRFESQYIRHAMEMRHDVLTLYKLTYGELERRVKELEKVKMET
ncbi:MAG: hypothetical protein AB1606_08700 [Nitrospirota bacterium]